MDLAQKRLEEPTGVSAGALFNLVDLRRDECTGETTIC
jgi:hypothetical protein